MNVKLIYRNKEYEVPAGMTVRDAIKKVGLQPETVLAVYGGKLITDDTILKAEMKQIKLVAVISGGSPLPCHPSTPAPLRFGGYSARRAHPACTWGAGTGARSAVKSKGARRSAQDATGEGRR